MLLASEGRICIQRSIEVQTMGNNGFTKLGYLGGEGKQMRQADTACVGKQVFKGYGLAISTSTFGSD